MLMLSLSIILFLGCSSEDEEAPLNQVSNPPINELAEKYFSIENSTYVNEEMPSSTIDAPLEGVLYNDKALSNGGNYITISSSTQYQKFLLGIEGVSGYYEVNTMNEMQAESSILKNEVHEYFTYTIPLIYSVNLSEDITIVICGVTIDGYITRGYEAECSIVETIPGDLLINLVFDQDKDVDLHLIMPSGEEIYYGHRGYYTTDAETGNRVQVYGLDKDSNPACDIDGLNNENISIPAEYIEKGTYIIKVNMYSNCDYSVPLNYMLQARYKGNLLPNELAGGDNPVRGYYPSDAGRGDHTQVMKFVINDGIELESDIATYKSTIDLVPIPVSEEAKNKLMMAE